MTHNPVSDVIDFLLQPAWTTVAFWLLMLASVAIACYAFVKIPAGTASYTFATGSFVSQWLHVVAADIVEIAALLSQSPEPAVWRERSCLLDGGNGKSAAIPAQVDFVDDIVLPYFCGFCSDRVLAQSADCSIADPRDLCSAALSAHCNFFICGSASTIRRGEWPLTYFSLLVWLLIFAVHDYSRSLGGDAVIAERWRTSLEFRSSANVFA